LRAIATQEEKEMQSRTIRALVASAACASFAAASAARAAVPLTWTVDSTQSYIQLAIPQQSLTIAGGNYPVRIINQSGGTTWTAGNKALTTGTLSTQVDSPSHIAQIEFNSNQTSFSASNSGSYIPNPAYWNGTKFTNDTAMAPADFGGQLQAQLPVFGFSSGLQFSISNVTLDMNTGGSFLTVSGGSFPANTTTFGLEQATYAFHAVGALATAANLAGQNLDNYNTTGPATALNSVATGSLTYNPQHTIATLTESVTIPFSSAVNGSTVNGTVTGLVVATAHTAVPGDVNFDGVVNGLDISAVASHWLQGGTSITGDANGDGVVNGLDISVISSNWLQQFGGGSGGGATAVPEPSTLLLAALAGVALAMRRRRTHAVS
jgi:hypothetical protein